MKLAFKRNIKMLSIKFQYIYIYKIKRKIFCIKRKHKFKWANYNS